MNYRITAAEKEFAIKFMETNDQLVAMEHAYPKMLTSRKMSASAIKLAAARILSKPDVQQFIKEVRQELSGTVLYDLKALVIDLVQIATADVNELVQIRRECCRYCWGVNHEYQWTEWEYEDAIAVYERDAALWNSKGRPDGCAPVMPYAGGGMGFNHTLSPSAECPRCHGEGVARSFLNDTRYLSPAAKRLYAGAKLDKNGNVEVLMHSQAEARAQLMRIMGAWTPARDASPKDIRDAADKVVDKTAITFNLVNSPDADD